MYAKLGANVTIVARDKAKLKAALAQIVVRKDRTVQSVSVDTSLSEEAVAAALAPVVSHS